MNRIHRIRTILILLAATMLFGACNFPSTPSASIASAGTPGGEGTAEAAAAAIESCESSADGVLRLCYLGPADGQTVVGTPGTTIRISAEVSGANVAGIGLRSNPGETVLFIENPAGEDPFQADFDWTPNLGSGTYTLQLEALTSDKASYVAITRSVTITGLPAISPTPGIAPGSVPAEILARIREAYRSNFHLDPTAPAIARKYRSGVEDAWVSTAFIGDVLYEVDIYPDGHTETWTTPIFPNTELDYQRSQFKDPLCLPAGEYSMLVVFLDFGNLSVGRENLMEDLESATAQANTAYAAYPSAGAGSGPILKLRTAGVVIPVPPGVAGSLITPDQIREFADIDPAGYDWIAQVDLDSASTYRYAWGGKPDTTSFGYAMTGCPPVRTQVNIQITIDAPDQLTGPDNRLAGTMLLHEVFHLFGYPGSHVWPCTDGLQSDPADCCGIWNIPALMLGWVDVDGDGAPEILDPTPYGIDLP